MLVISFSFPYFFQYAHLTFWFLFSDYCTGLVHRYLFSTHFFLFVIYRTSTALLRVFFFVVTKSHYRERKWICFCLTKIDDKISSLVSFREIQVNRTVSTHDTWYTHYRFSASTNPLSIKNGIFIRDRLRVALVPALPTVIVNTIQYVAVFCTNKDATRLSLLKYMYVILFCFGLCLEIISIVLMYIRTWNLLSWIIRVKRVLLNYMLQHIHCRCTVSQNDI